MSRFARFAALMAAVGLLGGGLLVSGCKTKDSKDPAAAIANIALGQLFSITGVGTPTTLIDTFWFSDTELLIVYFDNADQHVKAIVVDRNGNAGTPIDVSAVAVGSFDITRSRTSDGKQVGVVGFTDGTSYKARPFRYNGTDETWGGTITVTSALTGFSNFGGDARQFGNGTTLLYHTEEGTANAPSFFSVDPNTLTATQLTGLQTMFTGAGFSDVGVSVGYNGRVIGQALQTVGTDTKLVLTRERASNDFTAVTEIFSPTLTSGGDTSVVFGGVVGMPDNRLAGIFAQADDAGGPSIMRLLQLRSIEPIPATGAAFEVVGSPLDAATGGVGDLFELDFDSTLPNSFLPFGWTEVDGVGDDHIFVTTYNNTTRTFNTPTEVGDTDNFFGGWAGVQNNGGVLTPYFLYTDNNTSGDDHLYFQALNGSTLSTKVAVDLGTSQFSGDILRTDNLFGQAGAIGLMFRQTAASDVSVTLLNGNGTVARAPETVAVASPFLLTGMDLFVDSYGSYTATNFQGSVESHIFGRTFRTGDAAVGASTQLDTGATGSSFQGLSTLRQAINVAGLGTASPTASIVGAGSIATVSLDSTNAMRIFIAN